MNLYNFHKKPEKLKGHEERHDLVAELVWEQVEKNGRATPQQEDTISKNAQYSYRYARLVIKGKFPKGEDAIAKSDEYSYYYARLVIKGRFPKGEDAIAKDAVYSFAYAKNIIEGRFLKGEKTIAKYPDDKQEYEEYFGVKL